MLSYLYIQTQKASDSIASSSADQQQGSLTTQLLAKDGVLTVTVQAQAQPKHATKAVQSPNSELEQISEQLSLIPPEKHLSSECHPEHTTYNESEPTEPTRLISAEKMLDPPSPVFNRKFSVLPAISSQSRTGKLGLRW